MENQNTLYEWCLLNNIQPVGPINDDSFMLDKISLEEFKEFLANESYYENTPPEKPTKYLELRMYGFVPYNISPIQQAIQYGHAVQEYNNKYFNDDSDGEFERWRLQNKTFIILNGGTTNSGYEIEHAYQTIMYEGTLNQHVKDLESQKIKYATFSEPDLNNALTAVVFLADERVFNKRLYPDYTAPELVGDTSEELAEWGKHNEAQYNEWLQRIGGHKNAFLRDFLLGKKTA